MSTKGAKGAKRLNLGHDITMDDIVPQKVSIQDVKKEIDALEIKANLVDQETIMHVKVLQMSS